ncbi:PIN domain-like protein [Schizophyllum commune]
MGITGLLPVPKSIQTTSGHLQSDGGGEWQNLRRLLLPLRPAPRLSYPTLRDRRLRSTDTYGCTGAFTTARLSSRRGKRHTSAWLTRFACSSLTPRTYIDYFVHRVRMLRHNGVEPYIVFDGGPLPAKKGTENERRQKREESMACANMLAAQGKHSKGRDHYLMCVDVTPEMAYQVIKALRVENVKYVVAPYEADAQIAFVERTGAVHAILTEDSDLPVLGCKNILFKLDHAHCTVIAISRADFAFVTACDIVSLVR